MKALRPFLVALQFLTILPVRLRPEASRSEWRASLAAYPLVGLVIGALVSAGAGLTAGLPGPLQAALVLTLWVALSGALHLDGLADAADAWLGGLGDRERTLAIMKDPYAGPMAVVTILLCLLIKYTALLAVLAGDGPGAIVLVAVLARLGVVVLLLTTPYVRPGGLGSALAGDEPLRPLQVLTLALPLAMGLWITGLPRGGAVALASGLALIGLRRLMYRRLGGTTGDTLGATIEIVEAIGLACAALP